ncbi:uncharacterized protein [Manis javanica]|uniref:uncharacterized protein n=1 Tax=Manis javanica TaxID=9974 RepID=UPI003C6D6C6C
MRDFPLAAGGTHPEDAGPARGKDLLPQQRKTKRKKAYRWPALRGAPSKQWPTAAALSSNFCCSPRRTR